MNVVPVYHAGSNRRLGDNQHLTTEDWRQIWHAYQAFRHQIAWVVANAEKRAALALAGEGKEASDGTE